LSQLNNNQHSIDDGYFHEQAKLWRKSIKKPSAKELLSTFPEAKTIIPLKIKEWKSTIDKREAEIGHLFNEIYKQELDEFSEWFWEEVLKTFLFPDLEILDRQLLRLNRFQTIIKPNNKSNSISQDQIEVARNYPIYDLAKDKLELKPSGQNYIALCPFHNERTPSFYLYTETNSYHCYGCQEHGDVIKLTMYLYGIEFKDTVKMLQS